MPAHNSFRRALSATILFFSFTAAQQCFYPDGSPSDDVPCSPGTTSSCCGESQFCLANGLCFGSGVMSRGSCTDESWHSAACTPYCKSDSPDSNVTLSPCSVSGNSSLFVCGLQTSCNSNNAFILQDASSLVLRPDQVAELVGPALASAEAAYNSSLSHVNSTHLYTLGDLVGVAAGLGIPLILTICASIFIIRRQARRHRVPPSLLYDLPDGYKSDLALSSPLPRSRPGTAGTTSFAVSSLTAAGGGSGAAAAAGGPPGSGRGGSGFGSGSPATPVPGAGLLSAQQSPVFSARHPSSSQLSDAGSMRSPMVGPLHSPPPMNLPSYVERYAPSKEAGIGAGGGGTDYKSGGNNNGFAAARAAHKGKGSVKNSGGGGAPAPDSLRGGAAELEAIEKEVMRVELAARTRSTKSSRSAQSGRSSYTVRPRHELGEHR